MAQRIADNLNFGLKRLRKLFAGLSGLNGRVLKLLTSSRASSASSTCLIILAIFHPSNLQDLDCIVCFLNTLFSVHIC